MKSFARKLKRAIKESSADFQHLYTQAYIGSFGEYEDLPAQVKVADKLNNRLRGVLNVNGSLPEVLAGAYLSLHPNPRKHTALFATAQVLSWTYRYNRLGWKVGLRDDAIVALVVNVVGNKDYIKTRIKSQFITSF